MRRARPNGADLLVKGSVHGAIDGGMGTSCRLLAIQEVMLDTVKLIWTPLKGREDDARLFAGRPDPERGPKMLYGVPGAGQTSRQPSALPEVLPG